MTTIGLTCTPISTVINSTRDFTSEVVVPHELLLKILNPGQWILTRELRRHVLALVDIERKRSSAWPSTVHDDPVVQLTHSCNGWSVRLKDFQLCRENKYVTCNEIDVARHYLLGNVKFDFNKLVCEGTAQACIDFTITNCVTICAIFGLDSCRSVFNMSTQTLDVDNLAIESQEVQFRSTLVILAHCEAKQMRLPKIDISMKNDTSARLRDVVVRLFTHCNRLVFRLLVPHNFDARNYHNQCLLFDAGVYAHTTRFNRKVIDALRTTNTSNYTVRFIVFGCISPRWIEWTRTRGTTTFVRS